MDETRPKMYENHFTVLNPCIMFLTQYIELSQLYIIESGARYIALTIIGEMAKAVCLESRS